MNTQQFVIDSVILMFSRIYGIETEAWKVLTEIGIWFADAYYTSIQM